MSLYFFITAVMIGCLLISINFKPVTLGPMAKCCSRNYKRSVLSIFGLIMLFLWVLTAFRSINIGNDTEAYVQYFIDIGASGVNEIYPIEMGYQYYCLLLSKICSADNFILIVTATLCYVGTGVYILKFSKNIMFSLVLFFCTCFSSFTNILRQDLAMVIVLYVYQAIKNRKYILAALLIVLAGAFHVSAYIAVLLFFHKIYPRKMWIVALISLAIIAFGMFGLLTRLLSVILVKYAGYFSGNYVGSGWLAVGYEVTRSIGYYALVYYAYRHRAEEKSIELSNFFIFLILNSLGFTVNIFARASEYFLFIALSELPNAINDGKLPQKRVWMLIIGIISLAYFIVARTLRPEWNHLYPYEFWQWN